MQRARRRFVAPRGEALELLLVGAGLVVEHGQAALGVVERAVKGHHPDGVGEELCVGGPELGAVREAEVVQRLATQGEADLLHVPRRAHGVEVAKEWPGELKAALPHGLRVCAQVRKARFVRGEARDVVVPDVGVAADGRAGAGPARVHADHVEVLEHGGGKDRRAARLTRDEDRRRRRPDHPG